RQGVPGVAELGAAADGRAGHGAGRATDPDRRMRSLRWPRRERRAAEAHVVALVLGDVAGERGLDGADVVVAQPAALAKRQAQVGELGFVPAHADAEDESPAGCLVDR